MLKKKCLNSKKILQISCDNLGNGGVQAVIMAICRELSDYEFDIILFKRNQRFYEEEFQRLGGKIFMFPNYTGKKRLLRIIDYVTRIFRLPLYVYMLNKKFGPYHVIHCHNYFESGLCNMGAYFSGIPIRIAHSHSVANPNENFRSKLYTTFLRFFINKFSNIKLGCSREAVNYLFGVSDENLVINNGVDLNKFNLKLYEYNIKNPYAFIHIGQYGVIKNQLFLLDVFKLIHDKIPQATLKLIGFGNENVIRVKIKKLDLEQCVTMYSHDVDRIKLLAQSTYMIFPSIIEGFGIALIEAQAMGVYCFASNSISKETDAGLIDYLSLTSGAKMWAKYILDFIKTYNLDLKLNNDQSEKFDVSRIMEKYRKLYEQTEEQLNNDNHCESL